MQNVNGIKIHNLFVYIGHILSDRFSKYLDTLLGT